MPPPRQRLAEACLELLRIPSVTGDERALCDYLEKWARSLPGIAEDEVVRSGNSLIVQTGGQYEETKPCVALVAHLDTVPSSAGDVVPRQEGDRIIGLGASDMKGGIAVMQALLESLDTDALPFALVLVFYDKEEG